MEISNRETETWPKTIRFEPDTAEFDLDPHPTYRALRDLAPVYWWSRAPGWVVSRYEDCVDVLRDARFSGAYRDWEHARPRPPGIELTAFEVMNDHGLLAVPPEDHRRLRKLVSPAFTPRAIAGLRPAIEAVVDAAIDAIAERREVNLVSDLAERIPLTVIANTIGIPGDGADTFFAFGRAVIEATVRPTMDRDELARVTEPVGAGIALIEALIGERRARRGADLLSTLVAHEEDGDRLSRDELVALVGMLIAAGTETTVHLIVYAIYNLLLQPEQLAILRREPELLPNAIEEALRFDHFNKTGLLRYAREDTTIRGQRIRKGQMVVPLLQSALRDPRVFVEPDRFDIRRDLSAVVGFGVGPHYCLGAALARLEGEIAVGRLLGRFPEMQLGGPPSYANHPSLRMMRSLPLRLRSTHRTCRRP